MTAQPMPEELFPKLASRPRREEKVNTECVLFLKSSTSGTAQEDKDWGWDPMHKHITCFWL